jgi:alpha-N-arabinofuranosidase
VFGGYMEPATTRAWSEMLTDRKFATPVVVAPPARAGAPAGGMMGRFGGDPFRPVGPAGTVEMDTVRPFVGKHSPRVKLDGVEPHGIQQSRLRLGRGKAYVGRVYLAGDPGAKVVVRMVWGSGPNDSYAVPIPPLSREFQKFPFTFTSPVDTQEARLEILGTGVGAFRVGTASLMPADNMQGFNAGMIRLFREAGFKMLKWPGGNFVSGYDWRDGIGDVDKRPPRLQSMWSNRGESNDVGLHDFIALCRLVGAEPDLTINSGFGSAREAAEEVEYCNCSTDTRMGRMRAENGHPEPFNVRIWAIGNEMYGPWQMGRMSLNQYWEKHNRIVEAMREVDPTIKVVLSGASICERSIGGAEKKGDFFPSEWEPPIPEKLPWELGGREDWTGWLLANCKGNVDIVSEHTYSYPRLSYDAQKQLFVDSKDPLPLQARRIANRVGEFVEVWAEYVKKMPWIKEQKVKFSFDEWGTRHRNQTGASYQPPGMLTPLCYAVFLNEIFRHSEWLGVSCATGSLGTVLVDSAGDATGYSAEGLVLKLMHNHFGGALPLQVSGNSPQQAATGTPWVDIPKVPVGSPTYPLDIFAALSGDRKLLILSVVNPTESAQEFSPRIAGVKLRGPGKLWQIAPPGLSSANQAGQKPVVEIVESPQSALGDAVKVPPVSISVYEFEIA